MRKFFLSLVLVAVMATSAFADCPNRPAYTGGHWNAQCDFVPDVSQAVFDAAYWNAQVPEIKALKDIKQSVPRFLQAFELAKAGAKIDVDIHAWADDPYWMMYLRIQDGFTWVPNGLQPNIQVAPGLNFPGLPSYDPNNPPPGSIKVSLDLKDYPSLVPPPAPAPPVPSNVIGLVVGNVAYPGPGDSFEKYPDGTLLTDARGTWLKHVNVGLMGRQMYWELLPKK